MPGHARRHPGDQDFSQREDVREVFEFMGAPKGFDGAPLTALGE